VYMCVCVYVYVSIYQTHLYVRCMWAVPGIRAVSDYYQKIARYFVFFTLITYLFTDVTGALKCCHADWPVARGQHGAG
jgi:hypothetical protein